MHDDDTSFDENMLDLFRIIILYFKKTSTKELESSFMQASSIELKDDSLTERSSWNPKLRWSNRSLTSVSYLDFEFNLDMDARKETIFLSYL